MREMRLTKLETNVIINKSKGRDSLSKKFRERHTTLDVKKRQMTFVIYHQTSFHQNLLSSSLLSFL